MPPLVEPPNLKAEDMSLEPMSELAPWKPAPWTGFWDWFRRPPEGPDEPCSPPPCIMVPGCDDTCDVASEKGSSYGLFDDGFEAIPPPMNSLAWPAPVVPLLRTPPPEVIICEALVVEDEPIRVEDDWDAVPPPSWW